MYFTETLHTIMENRGLDNATLSKLCNIELTLTEQLLNGSITPNSSTIFKISRALNIPTELLIDEQEGRENRVITPSDQILITQNRLSLSPNKPMRNMDPTMVVLNTEKSTHQASVHEGEEFVHIIEGEIILTLGDSSKTMSCGDSIYFDTIIPHSFELKGNSAKIMTIVYRPL